MPSSTVGSVFQNDAHGQASVCRPGVHFPDSISEEQQIEKYAQQSFQATSQKDHTLREEVRNMKAKPQVLQPEIAFCESFLSL